MTTSLQIIARRALGALTAAAVLTGVAWGSAVPLHHHDAHSAYLRLSWSARPERIEVCRTLSDEELSKQAEHMRQRMVCDGTFATYALRVEVDGQMLGESVIRGGGLRHDRPMYLLRDYAVTPGSHRFRVSVTRREQAGDVGYAGAVVPDVDTGRFAGRAAREVSEHARLARAAIPAQLVLDSTFTLLPMRVALVRFDAIERRLEVRVDRSPSS